MVGEGDFSRLLQASLADGEITPNEMAALCNASGDLQSGTMALLRKLQGVQRVSPAMAA